MKKLWNGIGKVISGAIGLVVAIAVVVAIIAFLATGGLVLLGIFGALLLVGLIVGAIDKVFGVKRKEKVIEMKRKKDEPFTPYH